MPFDYDDPKTLRPALEGVDALFLITGYTVDMMVHSKRLLDAAKAAGVRHIVHLGALAADDTPHAHFAWHQLVERAIEAMGFAYTHLRPNFFIDTVWSGFRHRPDRVVDFIGDRRVKLGVVRRYGSGSRRSLARSRQACRQDLSARLRGAHHERSRGDPDGRHGSPVAYLPRPAESLLPILLKQGMEPVYAASLAAGIAEIEAGTMPLTDAVYDTVEAVDRPQTRHLAGIRDPKLGRRRSAIASASDQSVRPISSFMISLVPA